MSFSLVMQQIITDTNKKHHLQCFDKPLISRIITPMDTDTSRTQRGTVQKEEAAKLRAIWDATPNRPSQAEFGELYNIGGQSAVGNFLNGTSPLSLKAATGFAKGLGVAIRDFSPRLAAEVQAITETLQSSVPAASPAAREALTSSPSSGKRKYMVAIHDATTEEQIGMVLLQAGGLSEAHDRGVRLIQKHQDTLHIDIEEVQTVVFELFSLRPARWG